MNRKADVFIGLQKKADIFTKQLGIKKVNVVPGKWTGYRYFGRKLMLSNEFILSLNERQIAIILAHEVGHAYHGMSFSAFINGRCYVNEMRADNVCKLLTGTNLDEWRELIRFTYTNFTGARLHPLEYSIRKQAFI